MVYFVYFMKRNQEFKPVVWKHAATKTLQGTQLDYEA
jgi:hypothetical protein